MGFLLKALVRRATEVRSERPEGPLDLESPVGQQLPIEVLLRGEKPSPRELMCWRTCKTGNSHGDMKAFRRWSPTCRMYDRTSCQGPGVGLRISRPERSRPAKKPLCDSGQGTDFTLLHCVETVLARVTSSLLLSAEGAHSYPEQCSGTGSPQSPLSVVAASREGDLC